MEINQAEQNRKKEIKEIKKKKKIRVLEGTSGTTSGILTFVLLRSQKEKRNIRAHRSYLKK